MSWFAIAALSAACSDGGAAADASHALGAEEVVDGRGAAAPELLNALLGVLARSLNSFRDPVLARHVRLAIEAIEQYAGIYETNRLIEYDSIHDLLNHWYTGFRQTVPGALSAPVSAQAERLLHDIELVLAGRYAFDEADVASLANEVVTPDEPAWYFNRSLRVLTQLRMTSRDSHVLAELEHAAAALLHWRDFSVPDSVLVGLVGRYTLGLVAALDALANQEPAMRSAADGAAAKLGSVLLAWKPRVGFPVSTEVGTLPSVVPAGAAADFDAFLAAMARDDKPGTRAVWATLLEASAPGPDTDAVAGWAAFLTGVAPHVRPTFAIDVVSRASKRIADANVWRRVLTDLFGAEPL